MNEAEKRSNFLGLVVLFIAFTLLGIILSFFYVIFQTSVHDIWANIIAAFVFGVVLAVIAWITKRLMKVDNDFMSVVVVLLGLAIILYLMWYMWFSVMFAYLDYRAGILEAQRGVSDLGAVISGTRGLMSEGASFIYFLQGFNRYVVMYINETALSGVLRWVVWGGETIIIVIFPIMAAYASAGLFIKELNSWVDERLMNYGFSAFDAHELDRIATGDIDTIIDKPLEARNGPMSAVAVCYLKNEPTDFIAIYKASWDNEGNLSKGRHTMTVELGADKIDALDIGLQARHYPSARSQAQANEVLSDGGQYGYDDEAQYDQVAECDDDAQYDQENGNENLDGQETAAPNGDINMPTLDTFESSQPGE